MPRTERTEERDGQRGPDGPAEPPLTAGETRLRDGLLALLTAGGPVGEAPGSPARASASPPGEAAAALRAVLGSGRTPAAAVARLAETARAAGELDGDLVAALIHHTRPARALATLPLTPPPDGGAPREGTAGEAAGEAPAATAPGTAPAEPSPPLPQKGGKAPESAAPHLDLTTPEPAPAPTDGAAPGAGPGATRPRTELAVLVERHLAADPRRWRGLHDRLGAFPGTLPDLLASAPVPVADAPLPPASTTATLALLLEHTPPAWAVAAVAALPDRTVKDLLSRGTAPGPVLTGAVLRYGDSRTRTALAHHPRLDARTLKDLVAADDPRVNAAVYGNARCTPSLRRTIAHAVDRVPLDPGLRAELLSSSAESTRGRTAPFLGSGDPELVVKALAHGARGVAQRYALLRIWERRGAGALRAVLSDPSAARSLLPAVRDEVSAALDAPGEAARMRSDGEPYEDPATLPRLLAAARGTSTLRDLLNEPYAHDMPAIAAANRRTPFMPKAAQDLIRHEDATDEDRAAFQLTLLNDAWRRDRVAGDLTPPGRRLATEELPDTAGRWAVGMVRAGLLTPVELLTTARPAAHAVAALAALAEEGLWSPADRTALTALLPPADGLTPAVLRALAAHRGTLPTAPTPSPLESASAPLPSPPPNPSPPPPPSSTRTAPPSFTPPSEPGSEWARAALGAVDLLLDLAPGGAAPLPEDPGVLRYLAAHKVSDTPGRYHPDWLERALSEGGAPERAHRCEPPTRDEALALLGEATDWGRAERLLERAWVHGVLRTEDLLTRCPAGWLLMGHYRWDEFTFTAAWERAVAKLLEQELGTDPGAWLALAAVADEALAATDWNRPGPGPSWQDLLARSRTPRPPHPSSATTPGDRPSWSPGAGGAGPSAPRPAPATADEALRLVARGDYRWPWPLGALLCLAPEGAVAAVLEKAAPDTAWRLAAYLMRRTPTPRPAFERLLASGDRTARRILAREARRLDEPAMARLADLADPEVDLTLLRGGADSRIRRRIVARPGRLAADLIAGAAADPAAPIPGGLAWLESAEPDLIALTVTREGNRLNLAQQLTACLNTLRHGGPKALAGLADGGALGATATRLVQKALAAADPAAPITARRDRELAADRLVKRLRRAKGPWETARILDDHPGTPDFPGLEAAHAREPIPAWETVVRNARAPHDLQLRHAALLPVPTRRTPPADRALTLARLRHGLGNWIRGPVDVLYDDLLRDGRITGRELVLETAPAATVLAWLNRARRRDDTPGKEIANALAAVAELLRTTLGDDPAAWHRTFARLTEQTPGQYLLTPLPELLAASPTPAPTSPNS
ncbi:hypothetical protein AB0G74_23930 [Streptomyces sp. NPDC020875]|uniref:hypothetical protein n=1 Tax=Streptomyces sp. NPDC020875 TaxID=3154898 RepID=UPI0033F9433E